MDRHLLPSLPGRLACIRVLMASLLILTMTPLQAQESADSDSLSINELFNMSMAELMEIKVTVSSHRPELILDTPAIISRYDADEMAGMGLRTLRDMLRFIPGVTVQDHLFGQTFISIRGVYEGFNQKVLFLLDDTPYFMPSHSDIPLLGIPFSSISHIEIIRGPGAVYYGTNATGGVIKVVTRGYGQSDQGENNLSLRGGTNSYVNGGGYYDTGQNDWGQLSAAFEVQRDDGYAARYPSYDDGTEVIDEGTISKQEETTSALLKYRYRDFTLLAQAFESLYTGVTIPRQPENVNHLTYKGWLVSLRQDVGNDASKLSVFTDYNRFHPIFVVDGGGLSFKTEGDGHYNYRWRTGATYARTLSRSLDLFLGAEYEIRSTGAYESFDSETGEVFSSIMPKFSLNETSAYGQLDYSPSAAWRFLAGGRYTDNSITGDDLVPRLAVIRRLGDHQALKLLYSVGFNSPSFTQMRADAPPIVEGNPDLTPEKVKTLDLAYNYIVDKVLFGANLWRLDGEDFIFTERLPGEPVRFFNTGSFTRYGAEIDLQYVPTANLNLYSGLTYYFEGNEVDPDDIARVYTPVFTFNLGSTYGFAAHHLIGGSLRYIGERASADNLWQLNLDYRWNLGRLQIYATVENVLDEEVLHPNMGEFNDRLVPGGQGRNLKLGVRVGF